jgi:hypothetical protein
VTVLIFSYTESHRGPQRATESHRGLSDKSGNDTLGK